MHTTETKSLPVSFLTIYVKPDMSELNTEFSLLKLYTYTKAKNLMRDLWNSEIMFSFKQNMKGMNEESAEILLSISKLW